MEIKKKTIIVWYSRSKNKTVFAICYKIIHSKTNAAWSLIEIARIVASFFEPFWPMNQKSYEAKLVWIWQKGCLTESFFILQFKILFYNHLIHQTPRTDAAGKAGPMLVRWTSPPCPHNFLNVKQFGQSKREASATIRIFGGLQNSLFIANNSLSPFLLI